MKTTRLLLPALAALSISAGHAEIVIQTGFEASNSPSYSVGVLPTTTTLPVYDQNNAGTRQILDGATATPFGPGNQFLSLGGPNLRVRSNNLTALTTITFDFHEPAGYTPANGTHSGVLGFGFGSTDLNGAGAYICWSLNNGAISASTNTALASGSAPTLSEDKHYVVSILLNRSGSSQNVTLPGDGGSFEIANNTAALWFYDTVSGTLTDGGRYGHTAAITPTTFFFRSFSTQDNNIHLDNYTRHNQLLVNVPEASATWTGGGGDANWSTGANWKSGAPPVPGDLLSFGPAPSPSSVNDLAAGIAYHGIQFHNSASAYDISGNAIVPGPTLTNLSGNSQALLLPLQLGSDLLASTPGGAVYLDGPVSGPHAISKGGTGLLQLTAANTFSGGISVNQGLVELDNDQTGADGGFAIATGNQNAATLSVLANGTAAVAAGSAIQLGSLTQPAGTGAAALNVQGTLGNAGALKLGRNSILNVTGTLNQSGPASAEGVGGYGSTLQVSFGGVFTYLAAAPFTLRSGSNNNGRARVDIAGGTFVTGKGFEQIPSASAGSFVTPLPITTGIVLSGGGTLRLSAGIPSLFTPLSPPVEGESPVFQLGSGGGHIDTDGHDTAIAIAISGDGSLTKEGAGTLTLSAANTYTGGTFVDEGTLATTGPAAFSDDSAVTVAPGAILHLGFEGSDTVTALTLGSETLGSGTYNATTHPAFITGSGSIVVPDNDPFIGWIASFPSLTDPADREKSADPDKDGLSNLLEFALDGDPSTAAASGKVVSAIHEGHLVLTLPVRTGATFTGAGPLVSGPLDGVVYTIQGSGDLSAFLSGVEALPEALDGNLPDLTPGGGWEYRSFRLSTPVPGAPAGFLRAEISDAFVAAQ